MCVQSVNTNTNAIISCAVTTNCVHYPPAAELCYLHYVPGLQGLPVAFVVTIKGKKSKQRSYFPCLTNCEYLLQISAVIDFVKSKYNYRNVFTTTLKVHIMIEWKIYLLHRNLFDWVNSYKSQHI